MTRCIPAPCGSLDDLGLWDRFAELPQSRIDHLGFGVGGKELTLVDFRRLRGQPHPYIAMVPQWDLLNLLAEAAEAEPHLHPAARTRGDRRAPRRCAHDRCAVHVAERAGELMADLTVAHATVGDPRCVRASGPPGPGVAGSVRRVVVSPARDASAEYSLILAPHRDGC